MTEHFRLHERAAQKRSRKRARTRGRLNGVVQIQVVDPLVMAVALQFADGDARRLRILSATTVLVANAPRTHATRTSTARHP